MNIFQKIPLRYLTGSAVSASILSFSYTPSLALMDCEKFQHSTAPFENEIASSNVNKDGVKSEQTVKHQVYRSSMGKVTTISLFPGGVTQRLRLFNGMEYDRHEKSANSEWWVSADFAQDQKASYISKTDYKQIFKSSSRHNQFSAILSDVTRTVSFVGEKELDIGLCSYKTYVYDIKSYSSREDKKQPPLTGTSTAWYSPELGIILKARSQNDAGGSGEYEVKSIELDFLPLTSPD